MLYMLKDDWEDNVQNLPEKLQYTWGCKRINLMSCLERKPNPAKFGFDKLPDWAFREWFDKDLKTYLHHLFESRHGEAIMVPPAACGAGMAVDPAACGAGAAVANPRLVAMHHPQFFVKAHFDPLQGQAWEEAVPMRGGYAISAQHVSQTRQMVLQSTPQIFQPRHATNQ